MTNAETKYPIILERDARATSIHGLYVVDMKQITDARGTIREAYTVSSFASLDAENVGSWQQINFTETKKGAIRGLHAEDMNKLVGVAYGKVFGVYVDLRKDSPTKGSVFTVELSKGQQVFVPAGVGNGFQSISEEPSQYIYCFDKEWRPGMAGSAVNPLDPALGVVWPVEVDASDQSCVSQKDSTAPLLADVLGN